MYCDYHVHTNFSVDSTEKMETYIQKATALGVDEICFTDHLDIEVQPGCEANIPDLAKIKSALQKLDKKNVTVKFGIEMGLSVHDNHIAQNAAEMAGYDFDYIIGSVHIVDGLDAWLPEYFQNRNVESSYADYIKTIYNCVTKTDTYCAVGHYDFPIKNSPFSNKEFKRAYGGDVIEALFKHIISKGKCIEINTSIYRALGHPTGLETLSLYASLGGEYITIGSDSHTCQTLGANFEQARQTAKKAGIKYFATFDKLVPTMHKI